MADPNPVTPDQFKATVPNGQDFCSVFQGWTRFFSLFYQWYVWAFNADGTPSNNLLTFLGSGTAVATAPPKVLNLVATSGKAGYIPLTWDAAVGAVTYTIFRATSDTIPEIPLVSGISGNAYTDDTVADGTTYYYWVKGVNNIGTGPASDSASAADIAPSGGIHTLLGNSDNSAPKTGTIELPAGTNRISLWGWAGGGRGVDGGTIVWKDSGSPWGVVDVPGPAIQGTITKSQWADGGGGGAGAYGELITFEITDAAVITYSIGNGSKKGGNTANDTTVTINSDVKLRVPHGLDGAFVNALNVGGSGGAGGAVGSVVPQGNAHGGANGGIPTGGVAFAGADDGSQPGAAGNGGTGGVNGTGPLDGNPGALIYKLETV